MHSERIKRKEPNTLVLNPYKMVDSIMTNTHMPLSSKRNAAIVK